MRTLVLYILNILYALFGLLLSLGGVAYCIYVTSFTALRNSHHYKLDFNIYWPQVVPIVACVAGLFVVFISCCGCCSASKNNKGFTLIQAIFTILTLIALIGSAVITLKYGDSTATDNYLKDALNDGSSEAKTNAHKLKMFSDIERWLECCGVEGPSTYRGHMKYLPNSCCGYDDDSDLKCEFTSKQANDRHGCAPVAVSYSRIALKALAAVTVVTAFFGLLSLVASLALSVGLKRKPAVYDATDIETKKGPL